ncbi:hypothetical protein H4217_004793 [Coemansia sp. RSA 1939]|nr:hypothetical protein H4217_004793 [Coemansia sp. RSA 1939]KAJ2609290.1 hypothetical protein EV177_004539 [Coemansia sp. RSA 1804]
MVNATFYRTGGPIYMSTAGETPLTRNDVDNTYATELAAATGGMVVSVEHRFYGQSNPLPDLSGNSLKYLTVDNVLEDFASVVRAIKANETATNSTVIGLPVSVASESPVIFVGGSYPGAVAAWMRAKYPDLVAGAWSSAAAVYGRLENYQFDQGFGRHLKTAMVAGGGGSGCAECFAQAVADLDQILLSGDAARIAAVQERLGIPLLGTSDLANILTVLATIGALQPVTTVSDPVYSTVCVYFEKGLNQTTDTKGSGYSACLNSYIAMINGLVAQSGLTPPMLVALGNSSLAVDNTALNQPQRVWYYQMCTWFGMWQVAPPLMSNSSSSGLVGYRSQLLDLDYFQSSCPKKFGAQAKDPADVDSFNAKWFEILRNTSNVLYTSGSLDPWRDSTVDTSWGNLVDPPGASVVLTIDGATHAQDLQPSRSTDLLSVKQARMLGKRLVKQWVRQARRDSRHRYNC